MVCTSSHNAGLSYVVCFETGMERTCVGATRDKNAMESGWGGCQLPRAVPGLEHTLGSQAVWPAEQLRVWVELIGLGRLIVAGCNVGKVNPPGAGVG